MELAKIEVVHVVHDAGGAWLLPDEVGRLAGFRHVPPDDLEVADADGPLIAVLDFVRDALDMFSVSTHIVARVPEAETSGRVLHVCTARINTEKHQPASLAPTRYVPTNDFIDLITHAQIADQATVIALLDLLVPKQQSFRRPSEI